MNEHSESLKLFNEPTKLTEPLAEVICQAIKEKLAAGRRSTTTKNRLQSVISADVEKYPSISRSLKTAKTAAVVRCIKSEVGNVKKAEEEYNRAHDRVKTALKTQQLLKESFKEGEESEKLLQAADTELDQALIVMEQTNKSYETCLINITGGNFIKNVFNDKELQSMLPKIKKVDLERAEQNLMKDARNYSNKIAQYEASVGLAHGDQNKIDEIQKNFRIISKREEDVKLKYSDQMEFISGFINKACSHLLENENIKIYGDLDKLSIFYLSYLKERGQEYSDKLNELEKLNESIDNKKELNNSQINLLYSLVKFDIKASEKIIKSAIKRKENSIDDLKTDMLVKIKIKREQLTQENKSKLEQAVVAQGKNGRDSEKYQKQLEKELEKELEANMETMSQQKMATINEEEKSLNNLKLELKELPEREQLSKSIITALQKGASPEKIKKMIDKFPLAEKIRKIKETIVTEYSDVSKRAEKITGQITLLKFAAPSAALYAVMSDLKKANSAFKRASAGVQSRVRGD